VNKRTIIFISAFPFNEDFALKFGLKILRKRGFELVILNVFEIMYRGKENESLRFNDKLESISNVDQIKVNSICEFEEYLNSIKDWKIAVLATGGHFYRIKSGLKKTNVDYIECYNKSYRQYILKKSFSQRVYDLFHHLKTDAINFITTTVKNRIPYFVKKTKNPKYIIVGSEIILGGNISNSSIPLSNSKAIFAHSFDYDRYLGNRNMTRPAFIPEDDYYAFLPSYPLGLRDYVLLKLKCYISKKEYSEIISKCLDSIEEFTNTKIIIAPHPKSTEEDELFGKRTYIRNNTEQIVKYSKAVIGQVSTAINFAVIHKKPICLISSKKLIRDYNFHGDITATAAALGSEVNYIDTHDDLLRMIDRGIFSYNSEMYEDYMRKYVRLNASNDRLLWDIVADVLLEDKISS